MTIQLINREQFTKMIVKDYLKYLGYLKYFGDYKHNGETRNGAPVFVLDMAKAWWDPSPPTQATLSRHGDGMWYVQSATEPENSGSIFRGKLS